MPASGLSALISDAHIMIATEQDDLIEFHHVYKATDVISTLYRIRDHQTRDDEDVPSLPEQESGIHDDTFKILVETLGEVIVDYMDKKK
jgi:flagellar biosynthesis regulator FlbT